MRIAIIPARAGSRRIPRKNVRLFHGRPIITYSIAAARRSGVFDAIYVSTDSEEAARIATEYGAFPIPRSQRTAQDEVGTQEVMREALTRAPLLGKDITDACCIYATAPMLDPKNLRRAYAMLEPMGYVIPVGTWLRDPGQFYYGDAQAFINGVPLLGVNTRILPIDPRTDCDINDVRDWMMAEKMYETWIATRKEPA